MITQYVLLLWHLDRSGVQQIFGPYASQADAERARDALKTWPALNGGDWSIEPCTSTNAPAQPLAPIMPQPQPWTPAPWWRNQIPCDTYTTSDANPVPFVQVR